MESRFERITESPDALAAVLASIPTADAPWDIAFERATEPDCCGEVHWLRVVEDVKSEATKTRVYAIKRKLMRERLGIDVREV